MPINDRYLPLEEALSLELVSYPQKVAPKKCLVVNTEIVTCGGRGHTGINFGNILGQSGFLGPFRDTGKKSGTVPEIPGQLATMIISKVFSTFDYY